MLFFSGIEMNQTFELLPAVLLIGGVIVLSFSLAHLEVIIEKQEQQIKLKKKHVEKLRNRIKSNSDKTSDEGGQ